MITISDLQNINGAYLNQCITNSIPLICFVPLIDIKEIDSIYKKYDAQIIAEISRLNFCLDFAMNNLVNIQKNTYLYEIINNTANTRLYEKIAPVSSFQDIANTLISGLVVLKNKIEDFYGLSRDSFSVYSNASVEADINLSSERYKYPSVFNYYQGKLTLTQITSSLSQILKISETKATEETSLGYSLLDKAGSLVNIMVSDIQNHLDINKILETYIDYCLVALITYEEYNFITQDQIDIFLNRPYNIIRLDIITALKNHL